MARRVTAGIMTLGLVALTASLAASQGASVPGQDAKTTIWDGVYTEAQAARGSEQFSAKCLFCHRNDLSAGELGRALKGPSFRGRWEGPVASLYYKIGATMPHNAATTLEPAAAVDIVSFILKMNGAPAGDKELPPSNMLEQVFVTK